MAIHDLKGQIARLPEQPGVYLYFNAAGETIYVGKARVLRDRVRSYLGAYGPEPATDALLRRGRAARGHRHRLGRRGAGAREQPHQAAHPQLQHPAARRQELSVPAADDERGVSARAGGPPRRARRQLLRRAVHAGHARAPDDGADAPAVRDPLVQRGDHRQARTAVPRVRHQALHRAVRRDDLLDRASTAAPSEQARLFLEGTQRRAGRRRCAAGWSRRPRDERFEQAAQLRDAMRTVETLRDRQQKMATAELGDRDVVRREARARRRRRAGLPGPRRDAWSSASSWSPKQRERAAARRAGRSPTRTCCGSSPAVLRASARRRRRSTCRLRSPDEREALEAWLTERAGRRVRLVVPQARREARPARPGDAQRRARLSDALQRERGGAATTRSRRCAPSSACRRCRGASSASTSRRFRAARRSRRWSSARTAA